MFFAQQAMFSANSINTNKVEHGDNCLTLNIKQIELTVKYSVRFFKQISDHIAEDTVPTSIPRFTLAHALPSNQINNFAVPTTMSTTIDDAKKKDA